MFEAFDTVGSVIASAEKEALRDRLRYAPFFAAAEKFVHANGMIIGGQTAVRLLLGRPPTHDSFRYELYSDRARNHSRGLADALYEVDPEDLGHFITVMPRVANLEFSITVDTRELFVVRALPPYRGSHVGDVIVPSERPAEFGKDSRGKPLRLKCLGPEILLLGIYAALSDPSQVGDWGKLMGDETELRDVLLREIKDKIGAHREATGGRGPGTGRIRERVLRALLKEFVPRAGRVLVGPFADGPAGSGTDWNRRVQIVTQYGLRDEEKAIRAVLRREVGADLRLQASHDDPKIPTDTRVRRLTVYYMGEANKRDAVIDVFNLGQHELVPFVEARDLGASGPGDGPVPPATRVGTLFVQQRIRLVDLWTVQLLFRIGVIQADFTQRLLRETVRDYEQLARRLRPGADPEHFFPADLDSYIGHFTDPIVAKKRLNFELRQADRRFQPPYLPAAHPRAEGAAHPRAGAPQT